MKKLIGKLVFLVCISAIVIVLLFSVSYFVMPPAFADSYQKGFNYQYDALKKSDNREKIIIIGASYMLFATNSDLLGSLTCRPSYNLGITSGMGMCYLFETAERFIKKGDIIIFSFSPFKRNDYGMPLTYLCFEGKKEMFWDFFVNHPWAVIKTLSYSIYTKYYNYFHNYIRDSVLHHSLDTVYFANSFDKKTGNLIFPRPDIDKNIPVFELEPHLKYHVSEIDDSCIEILNSFDSFCKNKGAKFFVTYSPVCKDSVISSEEEIQKYEDYLSAKLSCKIISKIVDNFLPRDCVYNAAVHMNDKGAEVYTKQIYTDLCKYVRF